MLYTFLWNSLGRIKRNTLFADISKCEIQLIDIESLKAFGIVKLIKSKES